MDQLQIQVDVLQKLRESESCKRLESANETERLRCEKDELTDRIEDLVKVNDSYMQKRISISIYLIGLFLNYGNVSRKTIYSIKFIFGTVNFLIYPMKLLCNIQTQLL